ncbi:MAG: hypothetical protein Q4A01_10290 [Coriobacteriales bacterium]|nr:hypothetical protein [Coriobacteriales bacterium]
MDEDTARIEYLLESRDELVEQLASNNRRARQEASHQLADLARENAGVAAEVADELVAALDLPEAQTRWECLDALSVVALEYPEVVLGGFDGAENALFDEGSAAVRLSAFRFLSRYGMYAPDRSREAWSLMSEAVQCYHGDPEYREMLICLLDFANGDIDDSVRESLVARMGFDAKNGRGQIRRYSQAICAAAQEGE